MPSTSSYENLSDLLLNVAGRLSGSPLEQDSVRADEKTVYKNQQKYFTHEYQVLSDLSREMGSFSQQIVWQVESPGRLQFPKTLASLRQRVRDGE